MDLVMLLLLMFIALVPILIFIFVMLFRKSFRNVAMIARQTGNNIDDVIWLEDKFRVTYTNGVWEIKFLKMKEKTPSIKGNFWSKFANKKDSQKILKFQKEEWDKLEMGRLIRRGLLLYESSEGEFYPMCIVSTADGFGFKVLSQDNRAFIASETQNINSLTRSKDKDRMTFWLLAIGVIGIVIVGGLLMYFMNKQHEENIVATAQVCGQYTTNIVNALANTTGTHNTYLADLKNNIALPGG